MTPLVDDAARERIRDDTGSTLFVEAGAGSGKTTSLVDRVLTLVTRDGVPLSKIAAVTFTEKAGAELRDRLRAAFEEKKAGAMASGDVGLQTKIDDALDDLDAAAIGTLHSFAQRILAMFPIQAGLPPLIEVLDEVGSSVAFDARWVAIRRELLDDDEVAEQLLLALGSGITLDHLRSLAKAFGNDWDLIADRVHHEPPQIYSSPGIDPLARQAVLVAERAGECRSVDDRLLPKLAQIGELARRLSSAATQVERFAVLGDFSIKVGNVGRGGNWPDIAGVRSDVANLMDAAAALSAHISEATLRPLTRWIAERVYAAAAERRAEGRLEFHDLLVLSRDLLRRDGEVRERLRETFPRLLLDEFQDTDPIQIELAVRIAAGREGSASDWRDIQVPPGSLFVVGDPKQSIYRFRRASIETYLEAQNLLGENVALTSNFRTVEPALAWVNHVFGHAIQKTGNGQPPYTPLDATSHRDVAGPPIALLGAIGHDDKPNAQTLREREARDVAATIASAVAEGWTVRDGESSRPLQLDDIAVLVPARTSLPFLEDAFDEYRIPYRAEASSLVYQASEIRDLMAAARAIADTSDALSLVTALRSPLFGCGDDDLWTFRRAGGAFNLNAPVAEGLDSHPVAVAISYLHRLSRDAEWLAPGEVLERLSIDRRMLEVAEQRPRTRDIWRRVRFVIDQARAWSDQRHGGLRDYLAWASRQADDSSRVAESVLPETDSRVVRVMTVHAAKGLEFPVVILSGMTSQPRTPSGVRLLWTDDGYAVALTKRMQTNDFEAAQPLDEQMGDLERRRLLYVAATRAEDHLVVSLHRAEGSSAKTSANTLFQAGATDSGQRLELDPEALTRPALDRPSPPEDLGDWVSRIEASRESSARLAARNASGLEGTDPDVVLAPPVQVQDEAGRQKGARNLEAPPWAKGRYGTAIGRAVHGVLQAADFAEPAGVDDLVNAQVLVEGVSELRHIVAGYVESALSSSSVRAAGATEHWKESFAATTDGEAVLEGFIDLMYRESGGALVVADYKTDGVPEAALPARVAYYAPQLRAYGRMVEAATGIRPSLRLVFLRDDGEPAWERDVEPGAGELD